MSKDQSVPLEGRVAIITGASGGIGRAIALHLRSLGAKIVINYSSNSNQADLLLSELNSTSNSSTTTTTPPVAISVQADISNPDQVRSLFDRAEQHFNCQPHILINCAAILNSKYPSIADTTLEDWDNTFSVNARGAFLCCKEAATRITRTGGGRIIMLSTSVVGGLYPGFGAYTASKAAVETLAKILAKELKGTGISVNCVAPGPVATEMFYAGKSEELVQQVVEASPLGRLGQPEDVAHVVGFLATDAGQWINGQIVRVNGGFVI